MLIEGIEDCFPSVHQERRSSRHYQSEPGMILGTRDFAARRGLQSDSLASIGFCIDSLADTSDHFTVVFTG